MIKMNDPTTSRKQQQRPTNNTVNIKSIETPVHSFTTSRATTNTIDFTNAIPHSFRGTPLAS
jgi:hypothetical protein